MPRVRRGLTCSMRVHIPTYFAWTRFSFLCLTQGGQGRKVHFEWFRSEEHSFLKACPKPPPPTLLPLAGPGGEERAFPARMNGCFPTSLLSSPRKTSSQVSTPTTQGTFRTD